MAKKKVSQAAEEPEDDRKRQLMSVIRLRKETGAPLGDIRSALEEAGWDETTAKEILKRKGFETAKKRQGRAAGAGRIESYIHHDGRVGAIVEINCETDFVARLAEFQQFCRDVAMQVASQQPQTIAADGEATTGALLAQPFIKDQGQTIGQYLTALIGKTGERIVVRRFARFGLGETSGAS